MITYVCMNEVLGCTNDILLSLVIYGSGHRKSEDARDYTVSHVGIVILCTNNNIWDQFNWKYIGEYVGWCDLR